MRLKIRKLLKGGDYYVSFETMGFNIKELEKMKIFGTPSVDLRATGLGMYTLDRVNLMTKCQSQEEAERVIGIVKEGIRDKLAELSTRAGDYSERKAVRVSGKRKILVLSLACALALLLITAYKGVISSQQMANQKKQIFGPVQMHAGKDNINKERNVGSSRYAEASEEGQVAPQGENRTEDAAAHNYRKGSLAATSPDYTAMVRPGFTLIVVPQTLARYSDWGNGAGSQKQADNLHFKLIVTPLGGFEGPVNVGASSPSPLIKARLYPRRIEKLPGSSTLLISVPPKTLPHTSPEITVIARGKSADGTLITHEKKLLVAVRQNSSYQGPVWHVSAQGSDQSGDGSYGSPFRTIQRAIESASSGDTVLVEKGVYRENLSLVDKDSIVVSSHFILDQKEATIKSTVIEAKTTGWVVTIGRSEQVTVTGFTIQKGKGEHGSLGGGIYCYSSTVDISNNIIAKNENQSGYGAGIYCYDSKASILHNQISCNYNYEGQGAGIYSYKSESNIGHNVINDNHASGGGSGIHLLEPKSAKIIRNSIYSDSGPSSVVLYKTGIGGEFLIANNTVSHNLRDGIRFFGGPWSFENNIITQNQGYGLFTLEGTALLSHNNVWSNLSGSDTTNYYGLGGDLTGSNGNISADPLFGNPVHGNFRLCFNSPCINSADPTQSVPPHGGERVDMGAFEYTHPAAVCGDMNRDGFTDYGDINYLVDFLSAKVPPPSPLEIGDVNCDDRIDRGDLGYLYESLYYYGPEPCYNCKLKDRLTEK